MKNYYQIGDIVLVKFHPGFGAELKKYRPAVVVTDFSEIDSRFVLIAPFTTHLKNPKKAEVLITDNSALKKDSLLLCWHLRTIDERRIVKKLGKLNSQEVKSLKKELEELF